MLEFLYRKIVNNIWLFLCLLIGALFACGVMSSIPLYSNAVLQKVLTRDLENYHVKNQVSPGTYSVQLAGNRDYEMELVNQINDIAERQLAASYNLPVTEKYYKIRTNSLNIRREGDDFFNEQRISGSPVYIEGYENNIELLYGRMPRGNTPEGVFEVAVTLGGLNRMQLLQDQEYTLEWSDFFANNHVQLAKFKVVGIFTVKDTNSLFWSGGRYRNLNDSILISAEQLDSLLESEKYVKISGVEKTWFFDYHSVKIGDVDRIIETTEEQYRWNEKNGKIVRLSLALLDVLENYMTRKVQLRITLWILTIPMMLIICFYTIMISNLIIKNSRNEISVLKSRGAGKLQVFFIYMVESLFLSAISLVAGPNIGYYICRILGSSNGFLEFVNRTSLIPTITSEVYGYSAAAALIFMLFMLVPVIKASTTSIVEYKRSLAANTGKAFWQKFYLDVLILVICGYGYYNFKNRQDILGLTGVSGTDLSVDPLLFFISTFFILGISLLFLRLYPLIVRFIFKLGVRWWNPVAYFSLVNVSRADRNQQSIMLFIILSLSFGIISANQARTINSNVYDKVMYKNGADVVIEPYNNLKHTQETMEPDMDNVLSILSSTPKEYHEPPYDLYCKIDGYENITRVVIDNKAQLTGGRETVSNIRLMGITPNEFGKTVWFRNDLLSHHINEYLNLLAKAPTAVLLSSSFRDDYRLRVGDKVFIRLGQGDSLEFTVYGFIDYFPSCNPYTGYEEESMKKSYFAVINHSYIMKKLQPVPYEVWIKKQPGVSDGEIIEQLKELNLDVERVDFTSQELIEKKNDPILLGTNGVLTMCFIITMFIAAIGFVLFWVLSIREKSLKFGIFRAMGMPMRNVTLIMLCEQLLVSVTAIIIGILLGTVAGNIFIPMLEMVYSAYQQVPPFRIMADRGDYVKVLGMGGIMLFTGLTVLYGLVRSINIHQVLKMGEDS